MLTSSKLFHSEQTSWPLFKAEVILLCMEGQGLEKEGMFSVHPRQTNNPVSSDSETTVTPKPQMQEVRLYVTTLI